MPGSSFNLPDLFEAAFGYRSQAFVQRLPALPLRKEMSATGTPYYGVSASGLEYFMPVTLSYTVNAANDAQPLKTYDLPYPVIAISSRKNIIETPLTERRGTVKELINTEDYDISIRGLIISETNDLPEADIVTLRELFEQNTAIQIKCALTDIFLLRPDRNSSDQAVIKSLRFPPVTGVKNVRPYELSLVSDEDFNLVIN